MRTNLQRILLTVVLACSVATAAWADGWKLKGTTAYGVGGYWENGQKVRVDCSYKKGQFQYERKVSSGTKMSVYSTKAVFSEPEQRYAPGGTISINVNFSQKGESQDYTPYARMTVMPQNPNWAKGKGASNKIPASGTVNGQATDASGRSTVAPSQTATLTAKAPSGGSQMAIVYSCNGMDVVYLYEWDGAVVAQVKEAEQEDPSFDEPLDNEETTMEEEETTTEEELTEEEEEEEEELPMVEETTQEEETMDEEEPEEEETMDKDLLRMVIKLVIVGVVASLLIALIIIVFTRKK